MTRHAVYKLRIPGESSKEEDQVESQAGYGGGLPGLVYSLALQNQKLNFVSVPRIIGHKD